MKELNKELNLYRYVSIALLAALGAVFQIYHIGIPTAWGMWIDIVAVPILLALFLFDLKHSLAVAVLIALVITLAAPSGFIGAIMKFVATLPMFLVLGLGAKWKKLDLSKPEPVIFLLALALVLRAAITLPFNYYWALPTFFNLPTEEALKFVPWWIMIGLNCVQGIVEVGIAWLLAFKFKLLERYGSKL